MSQSVKHSCFSLLRNLLLWAHTFLTFPFSYTSRCQAVCFCLFMFLYICSVSLHQTFYFSPHYPGASAATGTDRHFGDQ